jgi:chemotaxis protein MotB
MRYAMTWMAVLLTGCVSQGTFDALQKDYDAAKSTLQQRDAENGELKTTLANQQKKLKELGDQIATLEEDIDALNRTKDALEGDKSAMLKDKSALQASIDQMKAALADLAKRKGEADVRLAEFKGLINRFRSLIDAGKLRVKMADGRMVVELASDVLFSSGSSTLSKDGKSAVAEVAKLLSEIPNRRFQIEGHTDNVPISTAVFPSNWELAAARALTVLKTMIDAGMPAERISAASFAESKPARLNDTPEGRAANRRIEIVVVPDLSSLPGFDELNKAAL